MINISETESFAKLYSIPSLEFVKPIPERPFVCKFNGCNRRFNRKFTLSEHMKTHTGEKPYKCLVECCGKSFSTSGNLSRHRKLHVNKDAFVCPHFSCKKAFRTACKLQRHMRVHSGAEVHSCTSFNCCKTFSTAGNLTRHMKSNHPELFEAINNPISPAEVSDMPCYSWSAQPLNLPLNSAEIVDFATHLIDVLHEDDSKALSNEIKLERNSTSQCNVETVDMFHDIVHFELENTKVFSC